MVQEHQLSLLYNPRWYKSLEDNRHFELMSFSQEISQNRCPVSELPNLVLHLIFKNGL